MGSAVRADPERESIDTDRFEVVRLLGGGGMGVVYEALDRDQNSHVALKTLRHLKPDALLRFKSEFRSLQDIQHSNLARLGELFEHEGKWFFTMELVLGVDFLSWVRVPSEQSLATTVPRNATHVSLPPLSQSLAESALQSVGSQGLTDDTTRDDPVRPAKGGSRTGIYLDFDEERLRGALAGLAQGLVALHDARRVHRDIKPSNILVTADGRVVILDFGLVVDFEDGTQESQLVGTYPYMAPEQVSGSLDPAVDWYAFGVLLYQALTGRLPFEIAGPNVLVLKQTFEPPAPSTFAEVPADLEKLCVELLRIDPAARPSGAEVLRRLRVERSEAVDAPSRTCFVGRTRELSELYEALDTARSEHGVTVVVNGESGIGKTALVKQFVSGVRVRHEDAVVLSGRCYERESVPFKAFDGVVDALAGHLESLEPLAVAKLMPEHAGLLGQVFPVLRKIQAIADAPTVTADAQVQRSHLFRALRGIFARLGRGGPLVVVIDDLQWADADSLALLSELTRAATSPRDPQPRMLLVSTMRASLRADEGQSPRLDSGMRSLSEVLALVQGDIRWVSLENLPLEDARALAEALIREANAQDRVSFAGIAEEAAGHPLFLDELVRRRLIVGEDSGPIRLEEALWARVERLSIRARHVLEVVAVAGAPLVQEIGAEAAGLDVADLAADISTLRAENFVRTTGARRIDTVEPYHDRVRTAVLEHLDASERKRLHFRVAKALEASEDPDPEALAVHFRDGGYPERAARHAMRAADEAAASLAFDRAARLYRLAFSLAQPEKSEIARSYASLADALANAGRGANAAQAYETAAAAAEPEEALFLRRRAAEELLRSGHVDEAFEAYRTVLGAIGMKVPRTPYGALASLGYYRARLSLRGLGFKTRDAASIPPGALRDLDTCWSVAPVMGMVDVIRGKDFQARALLLALDAGEPKRLAAAFAAEACATATGGGAATKRCAMLIAKADECAQGVDDPYTLGWLAFARGMTAYLEGRWRDCRDNVVRAEDFFARSKGAWWELVTAQLYEMMSLFWLGELDTQAACVELGVRKADERGDLFAKTGATTGFPLTAWLTRDDPEGARRTCAETVGRWSKRGFFLAHYWAMLAGTQVELYAGRAAAAHARVAADWPALDSSLVLRCEMIRVSAVHLRGRAALAVAPLRSEDKKLLDRVTKDAKEIEATKMPYALALALLLRAGVSARAHRRNEAVELLDRAAEALDAADMFLFAAAARRCKGGLVGGDGGKELVRAAEEWMREHGVKNPASMTRMLVPGFDG